MYCRILHYRARNVARGVNKLFTSFGVLPGRTKVSSQQNTQRRGRRARLRDAGVGNEIRLHAVVVVGSERTASTTLRATTPRVSEEEERASEEEERCFGAPAPWRVCDRILRTDLLVVNVSVHHPAAP